ncbi:MAG: aspartate/glutamate racemase family protein [Chloroflexi bacterium]|nr:aspartate/glutamate racemase family protein [Chloroflexota bacterium]
MQPDPFDARRIGLIVPSSNTVVEVDFARNLPAGATLHTARMFLAETTEPAEREMIDRYLPQAATDLASLYPDVVAFACTSGGAVLGADGERAMIEQLSRTTNARVVSTNEAVKSEIERHHPDRVAVITPYVGELNARIRAGLVGRGLDVVHIAGLGLSENYAIARVPPARILAFAEQQLADVSFDLLFISCTNFRGLDARPALRERFGVPVVTSNQATIGATLEALGLSLPGPSDARVVSARPVPDARMP